MDVLLKVEHVYYSPTELVLFKKNKKHDAIIKDISFELNHGEVLGIIGESGCGKTTLVKVISGILKAERGSILFNYKSKKSNSNQIQVLFQNTNELINPLRKVGDILNESFKNKNTLEEICNLLDIKKEQFDKSGHQLSGGERQRVGLARILSAKPELLILDEPFSAQDPESQENFLDLFNKIKSNFDISIICVSHDIKLLKQLADNIIVLFGGKVMEIGNTENIFKLHRHPYTEFLNESFNYKLNRADFIDNSQSSTSKDSCAYFSRCNRSADKCFDSVDEFISDDIKTYCNFPL